MRPLRFRIRTLMIAVAVIGIYVTLLNSMAAVVVIVGTGSMIGAMIERKSGRGGILGGMAGGLAAGLFFGTLAAIDWRQSNETGVCLLIHCIFGGILGLLVGAAASVVADFVRAVRVKTPCTEASEFR